MFLPMPIPNVRLAAPQTYKFPCVSFLSEESSPKVLETCCAPALTEGTARTDGEVADPREADADQVAGIAGQSLTGTGAEQDKRGLRGQDNHLGHCSTAFSQRHSSLFSKV